MSEELVQFLSKIKTLVHKLLTSYSLGNEQEIRKYTKELGDLINEY